MSKEKLTTFVKDLSDEEFRNLLEVTYQENRQRENKTIAKNLDWRLKVVDGYQHSEVSYALSNDKLRESVDVHLFLTLSGSTRKLRIRISLFRTDDQERSYMETDFGMVQRTSNEYTGRFVVKDMEGWTVNDVQKLFDIVSEVCMPIATILHRKFYDVNESWVYDNEPLKEFKKEEQKNMEKKIFAEIAALFVQKGFYDLDIEYSVSQAFETCILKFYYADGRTSECKIVYDRSYNVFVDYRIVLKEQYDLNIIKFAMPIYGSRIVEIERKNLILTQSRKK